MIEMDKDIAVQLMAQYQLLNDPLNQATELISRIDSVEEQKQLRRPLGDIMGRVWTELMLPIVQQYPELNPDK